MGIKPVDGRRKQNLRQSGQFLRRVRVPEVDVPAGAAEGGGGEHGSVRGEVAGRQEAQGLVSSSRQVPDEGVGPQTPQTHHLIETGKGQSGRSSAGTSKRRSGSEGSLGVCVGKAAAGNV